MPRAKAKLDPLLLSTTGTRVDNLKLDFPLRLQDIDDVLITGFDYVFLLLFLIPFSNHGRSERNAIELC